MTTIHLISLISLLLMLTCSAIGKAIMDTLRFGDRFRNLGLWWNPNESWKCKWKNGDYTQGEAFLGSSTIFVSLTDGWHFFQHFFLLPLFLVPIAYSQCYPLINWSLWMILDFIMMYAYFTGIFQIVYWLFNKK